MACFETTFIIDLLRGEKRIENLKEDMESEAVFIAAPSVAEIWAGALLSRTPEREKSKINELIASFNVLDLDEKSAKEAGEIEAGLIKKGIIVEPEDIMIAAIAKANGEKLVTRDEHYAKIPGLTVIKY